MKNSIAILFATDKAYAPHLATSIFSLLYNNKDIDIKIVVFTYDLEQKDIEKLERICKNFDVIIKFKMLNDKLFDGLILNHHFKKSNYYRLFAADLINSRKCLYLDADTIITQSIAELISVDVSNNYLAAVENPGFNRHKELGMRADSRYFNSGVMVLNLEKWRQKNVKDSVISLVKEKPNVIHFVDQCGLNGVVNGDWLDLNSTYNYQTCMLTSSHKENNNSDEFPVIIHFTGSGKPWHMNNKHPYKKLYWYYRNQTSYKSNFPDDFSLLNLVKFLMPYKLNNLIKIFIGKPMR